MTGNEIIRPARANDVHPGRPVFASVQQASLRDFWQVYRLEKRCFPLDSWPMIDVFFALFMPGVVRLKAVSEGQFVGFVLGWRERNLGWIATIGVAPGYRRRGIGRLLLVEAESRLGTGTCRLCVRESNTGAIDLYRQNGYRHVKTWKNYYRGDEDALVMEKELSTRP